MNKQIRELMGKTLDDKFRHTWSTMTHQDLAEFSEHFAELIIQECMQQVQEQYKPVLEDEAMMKDRHWDGYVQCGVDSYVAIREHFYGEQE